MFFLIPFKNDRRTLHAPLVTFALITANVVLYVYLLTLDQQAIITELGSISTRPSFFKIFSAMFTHASVLHLAWNMLFLWLFGPNVEDALGRIKFFLLYIGCGIAASLLHITMTLHFIPGASEIPVVGASGAIAGVLGVFAVRFYNTKIRVFWCLSILFYPIRWGTFSISAMLGLGVWFAQQLLGGIFNIVVSVANPSFFTTMVSRLLPDGIAYWSHIGGMGLGMLLAYAMGLRLHGTKEYLRDQANASLEDGITWQAAEHLSRLLQCDPYNPDVHAILAKTYASQRDADLAVPHYQKSIQLHLQNAQPAKAAAIYDELRSFYRNVRLDLKTEYSLARHMGDTAQHSEALDLFKEIAFSHQGTPEAEISLMRAVDICCKSLNKNEEAVLLCQKFLKEYPESSWRTSVIKMLCDSQKAIEDNQAEYSL